MDRSGPDDINLSSHNMDEVANHSSDPLENDDEMSSTRKHGRMEADELQQEVESQTSIDSIDQELSCGICLEILTTPYTIVPCLHTFDKDCLIEWWKMNANCPNCKKTSISAKIAFQLRAIMAHVHKNKRRKVLPPNHGSTSNEIFPLNGRPPASTYYDDEDGSDGDENDHELADDHRPVDGLIWPCAACAPNNPTGYTCPTPLPSPSHDQIQAVQARMQSGVPVTAPPRGRRRTTLHVAIALGLPGAHDHAQCVACGTYVPLHYPREINCGGCSLVHCNNFDPLGCPSGAPFCSRSDIKLTPHTIATLTLFLPPLVKQNSHEVFRLTNYINARSLSLTDILEALFEATRNQVAEELNEEVADEYWGPNACFCSQCIAVVTSTRLFGWWADERKNSLERQDGIVVAKPDCWYGQECRTQTHNNSHAERFNHICRRTRREDA